MSEQKWNNEIRRTLYKALLKKYGICKNSKKMYKKISNDHEFIKELTNKLNNIYNINISEKSGVLMQIAWALTTQTQTMNHGHVVVCMQNKIAAHEIGFITNILLPIKILMEYKIENIDEDKTTENNQT